MDVQCNSCQTEQHISRNGKWEIASGLFLAILPKCPFCIMAFTSTAMLCGEGAMLEVSKTYNSLFTIIITATLGLITVISILSNRKGTKTWYALFMVACGMSMVLYSVSKSGGLTLYYIGMVLVFAGVWLNGSLMWVWKGLKSGLPVKPVKVVPRDN